MSHPNKDDLHNQVERTHGYHRPEYQETMDRMGEIRDGCKALGHLLVDVCPISRELSLALTCLDDVNMKAIAALARFEPEPEDGSPNVTSHPTGMPGEQEPPPLLPGDPGYVQEPTNIGKTFE